MNTANIKNWISYWTAAKMVNFSEIKSQADVAEARKWCECMRVGVFSNVTDKAIWEAMGA